MKDIRHSSCPGRCTGLFVGLFAGLCAVASAQEARSMRSAPTSPVLQQPSATDAPTTANAMVRHTMASGGDLAPKVVRMTALLQMP